MKLSSEQNFIALHVKSFTEYHLFTTIQRWNILTVDRVYCMSRSLLFRAHINTSAENGRTAKKDTVHGIVV